MEAIQQWPVPSSTRALRGFLGLSGFYRRFIKGYASIAAPLTQLLARDKFCWSPKAQPAFDKLKEVICSALVLRLPDFSLPFVVETDALGIGMGAILSQQNHPIAFFSKAFCPKLLHTSTYVRELAAITSAVKKWRQYLLGHQFIILTDHRSLKELMSQVVQTLEQKLYLVRLLGYDYKIQYRFGKPNAAANALSRIPDTASGHLFLLTTPNFVFLQEHKKQLSQHPEFLTLRAMIEQEPDKHPDSVIVKDWIMQKGRI